MNQDVVDILNEESLTNKLKEYEIRDKMEDQYLKMQCEKLKLQNKIKNIKNLRDLTEEEEIFDVNREIEESFTINNLVKRYGLQKLKYINDISVFYYDTVYNYIWKVSKNSDNKEILIKPNNYEYNTVRRINSIISDPYLIQPEIFW